MAAFQQQLPEPPPAVTEAERPLSPHLGIYRPQLTSGMSIFHKITGIGLDGGLALLVAWLACLAHGREAYDAFMAVVASPVGKLFLFGWTGAFFYHMSCDIRHLLWAAGKGMEIKAVYRSGYIALAFSVLATLGLWAFILGAV